MEIIIFCGPHSIRFDPVSPEVDWWCADCKWTYRGDWWNAIGIHWPNYDSETLAEYSERVLFSK